MDATNNQLDEISKICQVYNLGTISGSLEQMTDGWINSTRKLKTTKATYILRQYLSRSDDDLLPTTSTIQAELDFISYLHVNGLPVVPAVDPPGIFSLEQHPSVFFPYISAVKHVNYPHAPDRELWQTIEVARFLGAMHRITQDYHDSSFSPVFTYTVVEPTLECENEEFRQMGPNLLKRAERLTHHHSPSNFTDIQASLPKGFLHTDLNADNVLFDDEKRTIAAVLDFDEVSVGPFIFDVAITLCHWCSKGLQFDVEYARQFLHEYEQARQMLLTKDELQLLFTYCSLTTLAQIEFFIHSDRDFEEKEKMIEQILRPMEAMIVLEEMDGFLAVMGRVV